MRLASGCPKRNCPCQRTTRRCSIARSEQVRRAETPCCCEVSITVRISSLVCSFIHRPVIGPTNPHSFFSQDRQFDRQVGQGSFLVLKFAFESLVDFGADVALLPPRLGTEALEGSFFDLVPDAGQIGGEETFTAE